MSTVTALPPPENTMGSRIRLARIACTMSMIDLAARCGVTRQTVHYWESHDVADVTATMALKIAYVLDVRPEWLILGREPMKPNHQLRELQGLACLLPQSSVARLITVAYDELEQHTGRRGLRFTPRPPTPAAHGSASRG